MDKALMDIKKEINVEFNKICFRSCSDCVYKENEDAMGCAIDFTIEYFISKNMLKEPKVDWSKVEVDTKMLCYDENTGTWVNRYFAKYENGKVYSWYAGRTSWTEVNVTKWDKVKLYEEGEK